VEDLEKARERRRRWRLANPEKHKESQKRYRQANLDKHREAQARYYKANPGKCNEAGKRWYWANVGERREYMRQSYNDNSEKRRKYSQTYRAKLGYEDYRRGNLRKRGLTPDGYDILLRRQNGVCAICGTPPPAGKVLCVDHDHVDKKVRGLLCDRCNQGIGFLKDSPTIIEAALKYVQRFSQLKLLKRTTN